jgi:NarL family two-component system sensor histidine kinase LiaS
VNGQSPLGLQWKLAAIYLATSLLSSGMVAAGYFLGIQSGLTPASAWGAGIAAGLAGGLVGSFMGFSAARSIKLRLWEAGDMAGRIARGDFSFRLTVTTQDEIGALEERLNEMAGHLEKAVDDLQWLAERNREMSEELGRAAALEERAKLARDLHDTVNQQLFALSMRAAGARRRLEKLGGDAAELVPELATLEELARQAHGEARKLILQLRPTTLEQQGLGPALAEYVKTAAAKEGWEVELEIDSCVQIKGPVAENLFRVAQEALNNASKHAHAHTVTVTLTCEEGSATLSIKDDGEGFDTHADVRPTAVGLAGMQERVSALGGQLRVRSVKGKGTEIAVMLPLPEGAEALDSHHAGG